MAALTDNLTATLSSRRCSRRCSRRSSPLSSRRSADRLGSPRTAWDRQGGKSRYKRRRQTWAQIPEIRPGNSCEMCGSTRADSWAIAQLARLYSLPYVALSTYLFVDSSTYVRATYVALSRFLEISLLHLVSGNPRRMSDGRFCYCKAARWRLRVASCWGRSFPPIGHIKDVTWASLHRTKPLPTCGYYRAPVLASLSHSRYLLRCL